ncbi:MAG: type I-E CRISPR-associated protein Cas7/Cse4/CasC [Pseudorhodoplanes sp.]
MSRFVQLHVLTAYPPSNPNRDDLGRPKTALLGNVPRMRISSQALKRAIRENFDFRAALEGRLGERTQRLGDKVAEHLRARGLDESRAIEIARQISGAFGKIKGEKDDNPAQIEQLAFISPEEKVFAFELADRAVAGESLPKDKELAQTVLRKADSAVDIAMFGRMLAGSPEFNREAAVQMAHAITVNRVEVENDYYTAVDDLKLPTEDAGAGFIGEAGFAAGVFYLYACVDRALLVENLGGDRELAARAIEALVRALACASPSGKRNSFGNHVRAEFILAERGNGQNRILTNAFIEPVGPGNQVDLSAAKLEKLRLDFAAVYDKDWDADIRLHVGKEGSAKLDQVARFCAENMPGSGA